MLLVYETKLFFLTIPRVQHHREDRKHLGKRPISYVIYRDGFQFYVYILIVSIINIAGLVTLQGGLAVSVTRIHRVLHAIFSARLVINLRKALKHPKSANFGCVSDDEDSEKNGELEFAALDMRAMGGSEGSEGENGRTGVGYEERFGDMSLGEGMGRHMLERSSYGSESGASGCHSGNGRSGAGSDRCLV